MRLRLIIPALLAVTAASAAAALASGQAVAEPGPAPEGLQVPAKAPAQDATHPEAFGYASSDRIARAYGYRPAEERAPSAGGASATVVVTAFVLPVRTIVLDGSDNVTEIISNTDRTGARDALYVAHRGDSGGPVVPITDDNWPAIRAAFAESHHGTGVIFGR